MKIKDIIKNKKTFSFEVFPPKLEQPIEPLVETLENLAKFNPDFISVTYGAGGTNKGRNFEICQEILKQNMNVMTHFTAIGNSSEDVKQLVNEYYEGGIKNMLALRGDFPEGWTGTGGDYAQAKEMIKAIKEFNPDMCLAGACYPEKHPEAPSMEADIKTLYEKQQMGVDFFVTQLCFDLEQYKRFLDLKDKAGVTAPIVVGLMPVLNKNGVVRMTSSNGCNRPKELELLIEKYGDDAEEFKQAGKEYTKELIRKYIEIGVDGLHVYSLNKYKDISEIIIDTGIHEKI